MCSETCVGKIRYLGVLLYDDDAVEDVAKEPEPRNIVPRFLDEVILDPADPKVVESAKKAGIADAWIEAARSSPVYKIVKRWRVAFPLHPEFRTMPMLFYVPPLSPVITEGERALGAKVVDLFPMVEEMRIPVRYLANMFTAGNEALVVGALQKLIALRAYERSLNVRRPGEAEAARKLLSEAGLTERDAEEMYRLFALARYHERFVIPTARKKVTVKGIGIVRP